MPLEPFDYPRRRRSKHSTIRNHAHRGPLKGTKYSTAPSFRDRTFNRILDITTKKLSRRLNHKVSYLTSTDNQWELITGYINVLTDRWIRRFGTCPEVVGAEALYQVEARHRASMANHEIG